MYCTNCGSKSKDQEKFCNKCGTPIRRTSDKVREEARYSDRDIESTMKMSSNKGQSYKEHNVHSYEEVNDGSKVIKVLSIVAVVLVLACTSGFIGYKLIAGSGSKGENNTATITQNKVNEDKKPSNMEYSDDNKSKNIDSDEGYLIPESSSKYLTEGEFSGFDKDKLALIRNEIFARHGYVFKSEMYREYFASKTWYKENPNFAGDESGLNTYEKANIKLIKSLERK
ncbi:YARHG domain-containing protein [Clostridium cylindrosporum]|uniref:YARHG domain-containing protein n=1 Tax=Clostridium cylindrosporum DSM 605 TaxID=1121307 RepID=A0A0J8DDD6_CLOCY|nr:YARHG domain-containing protein [Clostridium cylindrosporum]KMT22249.1 hypothetical protein CLCY_4c02220 [Clostridium cylindrosporum DSM 605]